MCAEKLAGRRSDKRFSIPLLWAFYCGLAVASPLPKVARGRPGETEANQIKSNSLVSETMGFSNQHPRSAGRIEDAGVDHLGAG